MSEKCLQAVLSAYDLQETVVRSERFGGGHINDTFLLTCEGSGGRSVHYILQGLSPEAFSEPEKVMENFLTVTAHLRKKILEAGGDPQRETLSLVPAADGRPYVKDGSGQIWRMLPFVEDTVSDSSSTPGRMYGAGLAFGRFLKMTEDLPPESLYETIPHFHDTPARFERFTEALQADPLGRAALVRPETDFILTREADCSVLTDALRSGLLPLRITHNDTKLDNVLFDRISGKAVCVVDLDTVMPGLAACDFGDSIRSGAKRCAEDETAPGRIKLDTDLFSAYTRGFLEGSGGLLRWSEKEFLCWGARLMTLECGIRFLTDYLEGDHYFRIRRPDHNLIRCRVQLKLVEDMENSFSLLEKIVRGLTA